jgi:hypothetical protein
MISIFQLSAKITRVQINIVDTDGDITLRYGMMFVILRREAPKNLDGHRFFASLRMTQFRQQ